VELNGVHWIDVAQDRDQLLKLQPLQNKGLHTTGKFPRCTSVRDMHFPYVYDNTIVKKTSRSRKES
jgi:hypothetical protein